MEPKVYINGKLYPKDEAKISVFDHGLLYGDGVFEGIRCYNGNIFKLSEHIDRLYDSAKAISMEIQLARNELKDAVINTLKANNLKDSYIRLIVTRGVGKLGLNPFICAESQVIIITDFIQLYSKELYEKGLDAIIVPTIRNHSDALNPNVKSLNYLNNILAKIECINAGATEAVEFGQDFSRLHLLTIEGKDITVAVAQLDIGSLIGSILGRDAPQPHGFLRFSPRIFQNPAFIGDV